MNPPVDPLGSFLSGDSSSCAGQEENHELVVAMLPAPGTTEVLRATPVAAISGSDFPCCRWNSLHHSVNNPEREDREHGELVAAVGAGLEVYQPRSRRKRPRQEGNRIGSRILKLGDERVRRTETGQREGTPVESVARLDNDGAPGGRWIRLGEAGGRGGFDIFVLFSA